MKELVETIAKSLVDYPEAVQVQKKESEDLITLTLVVDREDKDKVIGKQGRTAKSIRAVVHAAAVHQQKRVRLEIE